MPNARLAGVIVAVVLSGCGHSSGDKSATTASSDAAGKTAPTVETTTATRNLSFFTERYLPTSERLKRRQERLKDSLNPPSEH